MHNTEPLGRDGEGDHTMQEAAAPYGIDDDRGSASSRLSTPPRSRPPTPSPPPPENPLAHRPDGSLTDNNPELFQDAQSHIEVESELPKPQRESPDSDARLPKEEEPAHPEPSNNNAIPTQP
jgi:hypothetical protein